MTLCEDPGEPPTTGMQGQLKLFNLEYENFEFLEEIFDPNHPKILGMTEISILTISTHRVIMSGEMFFN